MDGLQDRLSGALTDLSGGAANVLEKVGDLAQTVESDLPGTLAKVLAALHLVQTFATSAHALFGQYFPNSSLPHPTGEGALNVANIAPAIVAATDLAEVGR